MAAGHRNWKKILNHNRYYFLMLLPAVVAVAIFSYISMYGIAIAFQDYHIGAGFLDGPWVGLKYFKKYFDSMYFGRTMRNTVLLGLYGLFWGSRFILTAPRRSTSTITWKGIFISFQRRTIF